MITIDVLNDLKDGSHLKSLLAANAQALFSIGSELAQFAGHPIASAVGSKPAQITIQAAATWKTTTGICFSLTPKAVCGISIGHTSAKFPVAKSVESSQTEDLVAGPIANMVYVNIELDFSIQGSVSGSGTTGGIGICGKASGSNSATLCYCHPVASGTNTVDAIKETFSTLVLPFEPDSALVMASGDIGKVNFDGTLSFELDVTYGFGSYKFSAPGVDSAKQSLKVGADTFTVPTLDVELGVKAAFKYTHSDHFSAIVQKVDAQKATFYLVRSAQNETSVSIGVTVGVSDCGTLSASLDHTALSQSVDKLVGGGGDKVAGVADQIQTGLLSKANDWLGKQKGDAGLIVELSRQTNRIVLYTFQVDLAKADLAKASWEQFAKGDLLQAVRTGGMTLQPGSGVANQMKRSVSVGLHFFHLFKLQTTESYFQNSAVEIGPDGSVRFLYDIGKEKETDTKDAMQKSRIHFVATAPDDPGSAVHNAEVDLYIELSETNNAGEANRIADSIGSLPASQSLQSAQIAMRKFASTNKKGTLNLVSILKPSAYGKLACSPYTDPKHPPALPQEQDKDNWQAFRSAAETLLHLSFLPNLNYFGWEQFNLVCNGLTQGVPDRRRKGNTSAVPPSFFGNLQNVMGQVIYFYVSSADFMNLCDDLHSLAGAAAAVDTDAAWDRLLASLTNLVKNDVDNDWSKPAFRAIFGLCGGPAVSADLSQNAKSMTCTLTVS